MVVVIEMVMLEEVDREITKKEADNVAGNISNLYSAKIYILHVCLGLVDWIKKYNIKRDELIIENRFWHSYPKSLQIWNL